MVKQIWSSLCFPWFCNPICSFLYQGSSWFTLGFPTCLGLHGPGLVHPCCCSSSPHTGWQAASGWVTSWDRGSPRRQGAPCEFVELGEQSLWKNHDLSLPPFWGPQVPLCNVCNKTTGNYLSPLQNILCTAFLLQTSSFKKHIYHGGTRGGDSRVSESSVIGNLIGFGFDRLCCPPCRVSLT